MRKQIETKISKNELRDVSASAGSAEQIEAKDGFFDFVVSSLVCCSVTSLELALLEIKKVLKPGGRLVFFEHVGANKGFKRRRWQDMINPFWRMLNGNCHLNRETAILSAGFTINEIRRESMRKAIAIVQPTIRSYSRKKPTLDSS
jgi:SAM-dependent methyltransferase